MLDRLQYLYPNFKPVDKAECTAVWADIVKDLTNDQILVALECCKTDTGSFTPTPVQFKHMAFGLHKPEDAYYFATKKQYITPAIYHAAYQSDMLNLRNRLSNSEEKIRFLTAYKNICERIMCGEEFESPRQDMLIEKKIEHKTSDTCIPQFKNLTPEQNIEWIKNYLARVIAEKKPKIYV